MFRLFILLLFYSTVSAQKSDILLLQKHKRTIGHFFAGSKIQFFTQEGMLVTGTIVSIRRDSLFLLYYDVRMMPNIFGTYSPDTLAVYSSNLQQLQTASFLATPCSDHL